MWLAVVARCHTQAEPLEMKNMRKGESRINMLELANEGLRDINILLRLEVRDLKERLEEGSKGQDKEEAS